jgi:cation diffusion facilitator family transporter
MANKTLSIYSALVADVLIAITKFIAGGYTNSSSMISEGIHSLVDTANQLLLLYGVKKSQKPADKARPFGYGKELYFWSFIVSILIFGLGGGLSIYQGILHIRHPEPLTNPSWNYIVLAFSFVFDGISFIIAIRQFNKARGDLPFWKAVIKSKDPSTFVVLFEDGAAVLGLMIVFVFMLFNQFLKMPVLDGIASVLVGLLLIFVSLILARESRSLLMGEGITPETRQKIKDLVERDETVVKVSNILSTYQSPDEIILMLLIKFKPDLDTAEIGNAIDRIRGVIKETFTLVEFVLIQPHGNEPPQINTT